MNIFYLIVLVLVHAGFQYGSDTAGTFNNSEIHWFKLSEAQEKSKKDGKPLFIFVEAEWCGICKRMQNTVFPHPEISDLLKNNFHPVLIDLDSRKTVRFNGEEFTERNFARILQVQQTPTMIFIAADGEVMGRQPGFMDREELKNLLLYVRSDQFGLIPLSEFQGN